MKTKDIEYKDGDTPLEGYLAWEDGAAGQRPGVIVVHEWNGLQDYAKSRAKQLAGLGYLAFCADVYGKGVRPKTMEACAAEAGKYRSGDWSLLRGRMLAALEEFGKNPDIDPKRIAAIGYCFGGSAVLELARSGADIAGVVSFHGGLQHPNPERAKDIRCKVLVCHGAEDTFVPPEAVEAFEKEMSATDADWQVDIYSKATHGFTNPDNGTDPSGGLAYNQEADERSWQAMRDFFDEIFK